MSEFREHNPSSSDLDIMVCRPYIFKEALKYLDHPGAFMVGMP